MQQKLSGLCEVTQKSNNADLGFNSASCSEMNVRRANQNLKKKTKVC